MINEKKINPILLQNGVQFFQEDLYYSIIIFFVTEELPAFTV